MPPKVKITEAKIVNAAIEIVRKKGSDSLNAREIAARLGCSTQPIFSNFNTMEDLRHKVICAADRIYQKYIKSEIDSKKHPEYKATGMAYIRFAKEEKELFKLLFMRDRSNEKSPIVFSDDITDIVQNNTGLSGERAQLFHFEMWAYVHGIASMVATNFANLDWELVSLMLTDAYQGLRKRYEKE